MIDPIHRILQATKHCRITSFCNDCYLLSRFNNAVQVIDSLYSKHRTLLSAKQNTVIRLAWYPLIYWICSDGSCRAIVGVPPTDLNMLFHYRVHRHEGTSTILIFTATGYRYRNILFCRVKSYCEHCIYYWWLLSCPDIVCTSSLAVVICKWFVVLPQAMPSCLDLSLSIWLL